jgi:hypothetical protein
LGISAPTHPHTHTPAPTHPHPHRPISLMGHTRAPETCSWRLGRSGRLGKRQRTGPRGGETLETDGRNPGQRLQPCTAGSGQPSASAPRGTEQESTPSTSTCASPSSRKIATRWAPFPSSAAMLLSVSPPPFHPSPCSVSALSPLSRSRSLSDARTGLSCRTLTTTKGRVGKSCDQRL